MARKCSFQVNSMDSEPSFIFQISHIYEMSVNLVLATLSILLRVDRVRVRQKEEEESKTYRTSFTHCVYYTFYKKFNFCLTQIVQIKFVIFFQF